MAFKMTTLDELYTHGRPSVCFQALHSGTPGSVLCRCTWHEAASASLQCPSHASAPLRALSPAGPQTPARGVPQLWVVPDGRVT